MILKLNSTSIEGSESSLGRQENTAPDVIIQKVSITPEKFKDDVEALAGISVRNISFPVSALKLHWVNFLL